MKCCFCGRDAGEYGNNVDPIEIEGRACDECNMRYVIPARLDPKYLASLNYAIDASNSNE